MSESLKRAFCRAVFGGAAVVVLAWAGHVGAQTQTTTTGGQQGGTSFGGSSTRPGSTGSTGQGGGQNGLGQSSAITAPQGGFGIGTTTSRSAFRLGQTGSTASNGNQLTQFYQNPMAPGLLGNTTRQFGTPLFSNTGSGSTGGLSSGFGVSPTGGMNTGTGGTGTRTGGFGGTGGSTTGSFGRTGTGTGGTGTGTFGSGSSTLGGQGLQGGGRTGATGFGGTGTGLTGGAGGFGGQSALGVGAGTGRGATGMTGGLTGGLNTGLGGTSMLGGRGTTTGARSNNAARSVPYVAELAPSVRPQATPVAAGNFRTQVQNVITRSRAFAANRDIQVNTEGQVVVLQGAVADDRERQLAEALLRLTPGVRDVRNELQVRETTPAPAPIPD